MRQIFCSLFFVLFTIVSFAQTDVVPAANVPHPDTVSVGMYVTSIHDIDFKQKEYTVSFWLWMKYKNRALDFVKNLEIPNAKSVTKEFSTIDSSKEKVYMLMKIQALMKDSWKIGNFPFDRQRLRLSFENSQFDSTALIMIPDTLGEHYDHRFALNGWDIDSFEMRSGRRLYTTGFGDESLAKPQTVYSSLKVMIDIDRDATGLFWKMFLGMYIAFLIAYVCFYIHPDGMDSRFGLSVGSLFAVIGNKYIIDSSLPESTSFTLVDTLHGLTLFAIFLIITATAVSLHFVKQDKLRKARRFDMIAAQIVIAFYLFANIWFIWKASKAG